MSLSKKIKSIRLAKQLKQSEVADKIGVEQSYYSKLERTSGDRIYFDVLLKICEALEVSVEYLLGYGDGKGTAYSKDSLMRLVIKLKKQELRIIDKMKFLDDHNFEFEKLSLRKESERVKEIIRMIENDFDLGFVWDESLDE